MGDAIFVVGVVIGVAVLLARALADRFNIPDAVLFVVLGGLASLLPGMPRIMPTPDVVLLLLLPPLVYFAGFSSDPRAARAEAISISGLAVGLVLATSFLVAVVVHELTPETVGWAESLAIGAAVSPPDPVAASSVLQRLGAPRRLTTILQGEGLVNDGTALTLFAVAVAAVEQPVGPGFVALRLLEEVGGGLLWGLVVGVGIARARRLVHDTGSQVVLSLLTPYVAYIPADRLHGSGVLATLAASVWLGTRGRGVFQPASRLQTEAFWRVLVFLVESLVFVLVGLQARGLLDGVRGYPAGQLTLDAALVVVVVVVVRLLWEVVVPPVTHRLIPRAREAATLRLRLVTGWCGLRGAVTLAIALSLPENLKDGSPFPQRELMLFLALVVVIVTLVVQGGTLPFLVRRLGVAAAPDEQSEAVRVREAVARAAIRRLDQLSDDGSAHSEAITALRATYSSQVAELTGHSAPGLSVRELRLELIDCQRTALRDLYDSHGVSGATMRAVSRDLDLLESRLRTWRSVDRGRRADSGHRGDSDRHDV